MQPRPKPVPAKQWYDAHPSRLPAVPPDVRAQHEARGPGGFELVVTAHQRGDAATIATAPDGTPIEMGKTLRALRAEFGGEVGQVRHPIGGQLLEVSLAPWRGADPDTTIVIISFIERLD